MVKSRYLTTSIEAAPDLKKSVESSIWLTLVRMLCHTVCEETSSKVSIGQFLEHKYTLCPQMPLPSSVQRRFSPPQ